MRYLLDSDIIIDYLRKYKPTIELINKLIGGNDDLFVSAVTNLELHTGKSITQAETLQKIDQLFNDIDTVDITFEIAGRAGDFRRIYNTPVPDALIAASAHMTKATLITRNIKHFRNIKEVEVKNI